MNAYWSRPEASAQQQSSRRRRRSAARGRRPGSAGTARSMAYATSSGPACTAACWSSSSSAAAVDAAPLRARAARRSRVRAARRGGGQGVAGRTGRSRGRPVAVPRAAGARRCRCRRRRLRARPRLVRHGRRRRAVVDRPSPAVGRRPRRPSPRRPSPDISWRYSAFVPQQFLVRADRGDPAARQQRHPVGEQHRRGRCATTSAVVSASTSRSAASTSGLRVHVERGQRVVQHEEAGPADHRPGQREALPLAAGQAQALLADLGVGAVRQRVHEVRPGATSRRAGSSSRLVRRPLSAPISTFSADARGEERRLLEGHGHPGAQLGTGERRDVLPVQRDPAGRHLVQPRNERGQRRLAAAGRPDEGHGLAGPDVQIDAVQYGRGAGGRVGVAEPDALEAQSVRSAVRTRPRRGPPRVRPAARPAAPARPSPRSTGPSPSPPPGSSPAGSRSTRRASAAPAPSTGTRRACPPTARRPPPGSCPSTSAAPIGISGSVMISAQIPASSRALRSSVPRSRSDSARNARAWLRCRPNPLMMRMPSTALLDDRRQIADLVLRLARRERVPLLEDRAQPHQGDDRRQEDQPQRPLLGQQDDATDQDRRRR